MRAEAILEVSKLPEWVNLQAGSQMTAAEHTFFPREHGATAMLLTPFAAAALLAREVRWPEAPALIAVVAVFAMQDPLVVIARQRWVWRDPHPESRAALRWVAAEAALAMVCGIALAAAGPLLAYSVLLFGAGCFSALTVWVNLRNRQRSVIFQVASAIALTSSSLIAALAATGTIPSWCWSLWALLALQAAAGIFTVHARIDSRIAARKAGAARNLGKTASRRPALVFAALLATGGLMALVARNYWISGALLLAAIGYLGDLMRQLNPKSLKMPLTAVGLQALTLSLVYAAMVIAGLWS